MLGKRVDYVVWHVRARSWRPDGTSPGPREPPHHASLRLALADLGCGEVSVTHALSSRSRCGSCEPWHHRTHSLPTPAACIRRCVASRHGMACPGARASVVRVVATEPPRDLASRLSPAVRPLIRSAFHPPTPLPYPHRREPGVASRRRTRRSSAPTPGPAPETGGGVWFELGCAWRRDRAAVRPGGGARAPACGDSRGEARCVRAAAREHPRAATREARRGASGRRRASTRVRRLARRGAVRPRCARRDAGLDFKPHPAPGFGGGAGGGGRRTPSPPRRCRARFVVSQLRSIVRRRRAGRPGVGADANHRRHACSRRRVHAYAPIPSPRYPTIACRALSSPRGP